MSGTAFTIRIRCVLSLALGEAPETMQNPNFGSYYKFKKFLLPASQLFQQGALSVKA